MRTIGVALFTTFLGACTAAPPPQVNVSCGPGAGGEPNGGTPGAGGNDPGAGGGGSGAGGSGPGAGGSGAVVPPGQWTNATSNLAGLDSECGNLAGLFGKLDDDMIIAGVALRGLWSTSDGGSSWVALGTGAGSDAITNRPIAVTFDPDHPGTFWEAGIYNGGGGYKTIDNGVTFKQLGELFHSDLVSVDFTDPERKTLLGAGHEQPQVLRKSTDGGATWNDIGSTLPAGANCTNPLVLDTQTFLVGCERGMEGIVRSSDGGATWTQVATVGGAREPLHASDGTVYWSSLNGDKLARSSDGGVTWEGVAGGGGGVYPVHPIELPDGRIATLSHDNVIVSADKGETWELGSAKLPYDDAFGVVYSAMHKAFFVFHASCGQMTVPVPSDAVMRFPFDYETQ